MRLKDMTNVQLLVTLQNRLFDSAKNPESARKAADYKKALEELGRRLNMTAEEIETVYQTA